MRAYSGLKYLCDALTDLGVDIELWGLIPRELVGEARDWRYPVRSFLCTWYGSIRRFRMWAMWWHVLLLGLLTKRDILYVDLTFIRQIALIKAIRPKKRLIHYCPEYYTEQDKPYDRALFRCYRRHSNMADMVVDVERNRAALRMLEFGLTRMPLVIPNSIPLRALPPPSPEGTLARLAGGTPLPGLPILLYCGGAGPETGIETIIDAVADMATPAFFLAFCYGTNERLAALRELCERKVGGHRARICDAAPRGLLLAAMHEADAAIMYYPVDMCLNTKYCAPSKVYEYLSAGLPVVSSANPSMRELLMDRDVGTCAADDSSAELKDAIARLLSDRPRLNAIRVRARAQFIQELSYEQLSREPIAHLFDWLSGRLKKGAGPELTRGNLAKSPGCGAPVPVFQSAVGDGCQRSSSGCM